MAYRTRRRGFVISAAAAGLLLAAHSGHGGDILASAAAMSAAGGGGSLSCSGLEALWESVGGADDAAFMAAEIARAESGGQQYATDVDGDGTVDRGYWQINSIHGALSTYDPSGNARAAVELSDDGTDWSPWVTFNSGAYQGQC